MTLAVYRGQKQQHNNNNNERSHCLKLRWMDTLSRESNSDSFILASFLRSNSLKEIFAFSETPFWKDIFIQEAVLLNHICIYCRLNPER